MVSILGEKEKKAEVEGDRQIVCWPSIRKIAFGQREKEFILRQGRRGRKRGTKGGGLRTKQKEGESLLDRKKKKNHESPKAGKRGGGREEEGPGRFLRGRGNTEDRPRGRNLNADPIKKKEGTRTQGIVSCKCRKKERKGGVSNPVAGNPCKKKKPARNRKERRGEKESTREENPPLHRKRKSASVLLNSIKGEEGTLGGMSRKVPAQKGRKKREKRTGDVSSPLSKVRSMTSRIRGKEKDGNAGASHIRGRGEKNNGGRPIYVSCPLL